MFRYQTPAFKAVATRKGATEENLRRVEEAFLEREKAKKAFQETFAEKDGRYMHSDPYPGYDEKVRKLAKQDREASDQFWKVCQREGADIQFIEQRQTSQQSDQKSKSSSFSLMSLFSCCSDEKESSYYNLNSKNGYRR